MMCDVGVVRVNTNIPPMLTQNVGTCYLASNTRFAADN